MLTYRCNLRCPYCFANEFVNGEDCDIAADDFEYAVNFAVKNRRTQIGLIGGEPALHPKLIEFIFSLSRKKEISGVMVYTNGLRIDWLEELYNSPFIPAMLKILINCNSPEVMGKGNFHKLKENIDLVCSKYRLYKNVKFGVNLYDNDLDYTFIEEVLVRYGQRQVRVSLTVPDFSNCAKHKPLEQFRTRKGYLLDFFKRMNDIGVLAYMDCNRPPRCIWTDEEWNWLEQYCKKYHHSTSNITDPVVACAPVIDILPDLRAVRCFGMSDFEKVDIRKFKTIKDLENYFINRVDAEAFRILSDASCADCYSRRTGYCAGGCLGYKQEKLRTVNSFVEAL